VFDDFATSDALLLSMQKAKVRRATTVQDRRPRSPAGRGNFRGNIQIV